MLRYDLLRADDGAQISCSRSDPQERILEAARAERGHSRRVGAAFGGSGFSGSSKAGSPKRQPSHKASPQTVLRSFNTWAFKREQPAEPQLMLQNIARSIARGEAISFVLYWGKGPRSRLDAPDIECLDYLDSLARRVREAYEPGAAIKLIFTDTHAALNGHTPESMRDYFGAIEVAARERGFSACWLGQLTRAVQIVGTGDAFDDVVPEETLRRLAASAAKWYRGGGTPEEGALKYYRMNMLEKRAVQLAFPHSIFVTFNGSEFRSLFPERLPVFYSYSLRRGFSVKPWFLPPVPPSFNARGN
jgi:hypothetical protein